MSVLLPLWPHWLRPAWLLALLAVPAIAWAWRRLRARRSAWQALVDPHLLPHLLEARPAARARNALWLGLLAYALAVCALAGPSWHRGAQPLWRTRAPLVIAMDLSSAMLANDLPPSRLAQARAKVAQLLQARTAGQVALVAYADDAFTVAPLTDDNANVALLLPALAPDIMPVDGSNAGRAIDWSARLLKQAGFTAGDILLLSDHADGAAKRAAADAARAGYRVSVLGVGTVQGAAYRDGQGNIAHAQLDAGSLRALASSGGGAYVALEAGPRDLEALGVLDPQRAGALSAHDGPASWQDEGYWLLLPLLALTALAFRRGALFASLLLCLSLPWQPAHATDWWRRPDQQAHARIQQGAQAYRRGQFDAAAQAWRDAPGADAAYDLGNALAKAGDYDGAIAAYDRALRLRPGMQDAVANREAVRRAMRQQRSSASNNTGNGESGKGAGQRSQQAQPSQAGKQQAQAGSQQQQQQQQQQRTGQQSPGQPDAQPRPPSGQQQTAPQAGAQSQPATPADAQAQRNADAAQRARMQAALQRARPDTQAGKGTQRVETPEQRERRLADEAWLRRIPDDPGGLLRARFRIEYERRQQEGGAR